MSHTSILWDVEMQNDGIIILKTIDGNSNNQVEVKNYKLNATDGSLVGKRGRLYYIISPDYESGNG